MAFISVPCLYDSEGNFLDGALVSIDIKSIVVGVEQKPDGPFIPGYGPNMIDTLRVFDPENGTFFLNLTLDEYRAIVDAAIPANSSSSVVVLGFSMDGSAGVLTYTHTVPSGFTHSIVQSSDPTQAIVSGSSLSGTTLTIYLSFVHVGIGNMHFTCLLR